MNDEGRLVVKTYMRDHSGIYCMRCGKIIGKGQTWAEFVGGPRCGWQGCPSCAYPQDESGRAGALE